MDSNDSINPDIALNTLDGSPLPRSKSILISNSRS
jgi:hypothetical protein